MSLFEEADLEALYVKLEKPVYNVVYRCVWDQEEARDLTQDAFIRLWRMREKIITDRVESLLYKIALNLARSALRRRKILRWLPLGPSTPPPIAPGSLADELEQNEEQSRVRAAIEALPNNLRQVILLCEFTELNYTEVGKALSIPKGTVGSRRNRALQLLKVQLERP